MRILEGGQGSGNHGHSGRPGEVGGSRSFSEMSSSEYLELSDKYGFVKKYGNANSIGFDKDYGLGIYMGSKYTAINSILRNGLKAEDYPVGYQQAVDSVDDLISIGRAEKNLILYRGVQSRWDLKVGDTFTDKAFVSTSIDKAVAVSFKDSIQQMFIIHVQKGVHVGYVGPSVFSEKEIILSRNSKFRVTDISLDKEIRVGKEGTPLKIVELDLL